MAETLKDMIQALGYTVTTRQKHKTRIEIPPQCSVPNCTNQAVQVLAKSHPNYPAYRRASWIKREHPNAVDIWCCARHHNQNTAKKHNVKSAKHLTANRLGMSYTEYSNQFHPYLRYRKDYCENIDRRLGFVCNTILPTQEMIDAAGLIGWKPKNFLDVDHIDSNHTNNDPQNLQTLCKHCHTIKSYKYGDYLTPGRKTRIQ